MITIERALATSDYDCQERRDELIWLANQASRRKSIVEVGSWKGTTALAMALNTTGMVYAVDTFQGSKNEEAHQRLNEKEPGWLFKAFEANTAGVLNLAPLVMTSLRAAEVVTQLGWKFDMIFIDASHDYESVKADIEAWRPLLLPGGIFCGHDRTWDGVKQAVYEAFGNTKVGAGAIWYVDR